jgi:hypothetical protein
MMRMIDLVVYDEGDAILRWSAGEEKSGEPIAWFDDWTDAILEFKDEPGVDLKVFLPTMNAFDCPFTAPYRGAIAMLREKECRLSRLASRPPSERRHSP